jgi:ubiquinone/menaquinone biosynthesis C-methylase UbiE
MPDVPNRYADDWNAYSRDWELRFGSKHENLGDEWNDPDGRARKRDDYYFSILADRFVSADAAVLEVGPGGGKWSIRLAPKARKLICLDVADEMLRRTQERCKAAGLTNVETVLGNGIDFQPVADGSIDFFFSFDVFVHIALDDTFSYIHEMNRVLASGGNGSCHFAIDAAPQAFGRIETNNDWYRGGRHTLGQYFYHSPESLRRMFEHCGLQIHEMYIENWHCFCMFTKPANSLVPKLEQLLHQLIDPGARDLPRRQMILGALAELPAELASALGPVLDAARAASDDAARFAAAAEIRKIWRGLTRKVHL